MVRVVDVSGRTVAHPQDLTLSYCRMHNVLLSVTICTLTGRHANKHNFVRSCMTFMRSWKTLFTHASCHVYLHMSIAIAKTACVLTVHCLTLLLNKYFSYCKGILVQDQNDVAQNWYLRHALRRCWKLLDSYSTTQAKVSIHIFLSCMGGALRVKKRTISLF